MCPGLMSEGAARAFGSQSKFPFQGSGSYGSMPIRGHLGDKPLPCSGETAHHGLMSHPINFLGSCNGEVSVSDPPSLGEWILQMFVELLPVGIDNLAISFPQLETFLVDGVCSWFRRQAMGRVVR